MYSSSKNIYMFLCDVFGCGKVQVNFNHIQQYYFDGLV